MFSQRPSFFPEDNPGGRGTSVRLAAGFAQWRGTRAAQNDSVFVSDDDPQRGLLIALADGIGLDEGAGRAADLATAAMREDYLRKEPLVLHRQTLRMMGAAHRAVLALNDEQEARDLPRVGTAAACILIREGKLSFCTVGNVRVFLWRAGLLLQLNRDHLLSLEAEERDILRGDAPDLDPDWARQVTAFVGMDGLQKIDCQREAITLLPGDRVLAISSGLYGVLSEEELASLTAAGLPQQASEAIVERVRAMRPASQSNVSAAVAQFSV